jgi:hypothetical protein
MSALLQLPPFAARDEGAFLAEMNELSSWHLERCAPYRAMWPSACRTAHLADLPFVHVSVFKHLLLQSLGTAHHRTLLSSSTSGTQPSRITLDAKSSELQTASSLSILKHLVGDSLRPLLVLDDARFLRQRGQVSARIAAAMSLKPLASEIHFVLDSSSSSLNLESVRCVLEKHDEILVYGFTSVLWQAWAGADLAPELRSMLVGKTIHFVHSGGWKKLEALRVDRSTFDAKLLRGLSTRSKVIDYYGLVEQVGVVFPLCEAGFRHAPRWSGVMVRDPFTLRTLEAEPGMLQLMNTLAYGAPYHNVLTEDMGRLAAGPCPCGLPGTRFELLGRVPRAEARGCASV